MSHKSSQFRRHLTWQLRRFNVIFVLHSNDSLHFKRTSLTSVSAPSLARWKGMMRPRRENHLSTAKPEVGTESSFTASVHSCEYFILLPNQNWMWPHARHQMFYNDVPQTEGSRPKGGLRKIFRRSQELSRKSKNKMSKLILLETHQITNKDRWST